MEHIVKDFISRHHLLSADALHLVALSGGADSVCLLLMLQRLDYRVEAMHCNFHLRGEESDRDEAFVADLCRTRDVPLHLAHFDTRDYASLHHVSIEMAARDLRYKWFEQLRHDLGAETICVAHHSDDNVETILMNLLRGTGLRGLQGIQPRRDNIVRPLLCLSRADIEQWLRQQGQPFVNDSTNAKADVIRNKLRLDIIPRLKEVFPQATANILTTAHFAAEALRVYDSTITDRLSHLLSSPSTPNTPLGPKGRLRSPSEQEHPTPRSAQRDACVARRSKNTSISIPALLQESSPESLLFEWLTPKGFSSRTILQIAHSLTSSPQTKSGREWTSSTHILVTHSDRLLLSQKPPLLGEVGGGQEVGVGLPPFPEPGTYVISPNARLRISLLDGRHINRSNALICCADAATVTFPLHLRPVRQGDRFRPLGMKGTRLVSDFLTDLHLSVIDKRRQLVLCDALGNIIWLLGLRMDDRYKVTETTTKTLTIELATT